MNAVISKGVEKYSQEDEKKLKDALAAAMEEVKLQDGKTFKNYDKTKTKIPPLLPTFGLKDGHCIGYRDSPMDQIFYLDSLPGKGVAMRSEDGLATDSEIYNGFVLLILHLHPPPHLDDQNLPGQNGIIPLSKRPLDHPQNHKKDEGDDPYSS